MIKMYLWLFIAPLLGLLCFAAIGKEIGTPVQLSDVVANTDHYMKIRLRGSLVLSGDKRLAELSDLAWDADEQRLYGITDRGWLLHMKPQFTRGILSGMTLLEGLRLRDKSGQPLKRKNRDSEGLVVHKANNGIAGDSELIISFEHNHRIMLYDTKGMALGRMNITPPLSTTIPRMRKNKGMEALTLDPQWGFLTGPEQPEFGKRDNVLISTRGKQWSFTPIEIAGSMVALESLPGGDLLMLERAFISPLQPWIISIARIPKQQLESQQQLKPEVLAQFDSSKGWRTLNFEGLTRHTGQNFFMASDDNNKTYAPTQIIYFELPSK